MSLRIDAHQHFWSLARNDYGWLTPALAALYRDFEPRDLEPLLRAASIDRTVLVQAAPTVDETRYLLELADAHPFIAGVVGWVDMAAGDATLEVLAELAAHPRFVGVRPMLQDLPDHAWILESTLSPAVDALVAHGLRFDALVTPVHLPALLEFLERHPALDAVIDHGAKPDIAGARWEPWATDIAAIAARTGAYCKLSGLITQAGSTQDYDDLLPYMDFLLEVFGPGRLIWGSDWPVLNLAGDYHGWHEASSHWLARLSGDERAGIEGLNAARFYGL